jgi:tetratricopeptide (TPR) repeat protein
MGMVAEAIGYFEQASQLDETNVKYLITISDAWFQSGKNGQSLKYARKAFEKATDKGSKVEILEKIANLYYSGGDTEGQKRTQEEIQKLKRG